MNKQELERLLQEESLLEFNGDDGYKKYVNGDDYYFNNVFHCTPNIFGVYKESGTRFVAFITDAERGYLDFQSKHRSEEEACDELYDYVLYYK